jgi:hypothetical protein
VEIYINGERVWSEGGFLTTHKEVPLPEAITRLLKPTGNQIAVHGRQTTGGQYIDVGLARGVTFSTENASRERDQLLNGPQN